MTSFATLALSLVLASVSLACSVSTHPTEASALGTARSSDALVAVLDQPGPVELLTVNSADWVVPRSGVLDLDAPAAKASGLEDGDEDIQIYFHALRHPQHGLFIVDTGVERALRDAPDRAAVRGLVTKFVRFDALKFHAPLGDWLAQQATPLQGVFLTHLHIDHIMGIPDVPAKTPLYTGPGEAAATALQNMFVQSHTDRALAGKGALREWQFEADAQDRLAGVVDIFGDGSVWALWTPGHTVGSTAYLVRTPAGSVLLTGDTSHTRWGWDHGVAPGSFTMDAEGNVDSLARLKKLVSGHKGIEVRVGHQH